MPTSMTLSEYVRLNPSSISASLDKLTAVGRHITEIDVNNAFLVTVLDQCRQNNKVPVSRTIIDDMCSLLSYKYKNTLPSKTSSSCHVTSSPSSSYISVEEEDKHYSERRKSRGLNIALAQKLQTVLLSRNMLSSIIGVVQFRHVVRLSLLGNHIRRIDDCEVLSLLPQLQFLSLEYNPVTTLLHYRAHLLRICAWPHNLDIHTCRLRKLDAICVEPEEIVHAKYCIEREYILLPELMHRHQFLCFLVHLETTLKMHSEMAKSGLLVVNHLEERRINNLLRKCATAALHNCHTTASLHATRLWVSQQEDVNCNVLTENNRQRSVREGNKTAKNDLQEQNVMRASAKNKFASAATTNKAAVKSLSCKSPYKARKLRQSKQFYEVSDSSHSSSESEQDYQGARCSDEVDIPHNYFTKEFSTNNSNHSNEESEEGSEYFCNIDDRSNNDEQSKEHLSELNVSNITLSSDESSVETLLNWSRISLHNAHHALDHDLCTEWSNSAFRRALTLLDVSICNCLLRVARCCHETLSSYDLDRLSLEWLHLSATHSPLRSNNVTCSVDHSEKKMNNNTNTDNNRKNTLEEKQKTNESEVKMQEEEQEEKERQHPHQNFKWETKKEELQNNDLVSQDDNCESNNNEPTSYFSSSTSHMTNSLWEQKKETVPALHHVTKVVTTEREMIAGEKPELENEECFANMISHSHDSSTMMQTEIKHSPEQQEEKANLTVTAPPPLLAAKVELVQTRMQESAGESRCQTEARFVQRLHLCKLRHALRQWREKLREVHMYKKCIEFVKLQMERRCKLPCGYVHFRLPVYAQLLLLPYTERKRTFFYYWRARLYENSLIHRIKLSTALRKWHHKKCDAECIKEFELHCHIQMKRSVFCQWCRRVCRRRDYAKALFRSTLSESSEKDKQNEPRKFSLSPPPTFPDVQLLTPSCNTGSKSTEMLHSNIQPLLYEDKYVRVNGSDCIDNKSNCCYLDRVLHNANMHDENNNDAIRIVWNGKFKESSVPISGIRCSEEIELTRSHRSPLYKSPFIFNKCNINRDAIETREHEHQHEEKSSIDMVNIKKGNELTHENDIQIEELSECKIEDTQQEQKPIQIKDNIFNEHEERDESMLASLSLSSSSSKLHNDAEHSFTENTTTKSTHQRESEDVVLKRLQTLMNEHDTLRSRFIDQQILLEEAQLRRKEALGELERLHSLLVEKENEAEQVRMNDTLLSKRIVYLQESLLALEERHRKMMERVCNDENDEVVTVYN